MAMVAGGATGFGRPVASETGREVVAKVSRRLIPFLILCYFVAYLDRVNVGFAALDFKGDLGLSDTAYGLGAGIFFIAYFIFEVPSNVILEKVGARRWIARIMFTWGLLSAAMAFVTGEMSFYVLRFLLGIAEAGFFPGIILYLTYWFPTEHRARVIGLFMVAIPVSSVIGSPVSGLLLALNGFLGLKGWQWLFILEGLPAVLLSVAVLLYLDDRPKDAKWLAPDERTWLQDRLDRETAHRQSHHDFTLWQALSHPRVLALGLVYFGVVAAVYGLSFWLPQIVKNFGLTNSQTGFVTAIPYLFGAIAMVFWGRHSDATGERTWHVAIPSFLTAAGLAASAYLQDPTLTMVAITLAAVGIFCALPTFWTLPTAILSGTAAAGGIALINSVGNLAGFGGPYMIGWVKDNLSGGLSTALLILAAMPFISGVIAVALGHDRALEMHPAEHAPEALRP